MSASSLTARWAIALVVSALVATTAAGCVSAPALTGPGAAAPPASADADVSHDVPERDALIQAVQGAAALISSSEAEPFQDWAQPCIFGDGVMFKYSVSIPDDGDAQPAYESIASLWNTLGIEANVDSNGVSISGDQREARTGPVYLVSAVYVDAFGDSPAEYQVIGYSHCVPGETADYSHLTGH